MKPIVKNPNDIKLAMIGMNEGNGHPYSWTAIFNGYNKEIMAECPYAGIPEYLEKEPSENLNMAGVQVTHIWTDNPEDAKHVSKASLIPNIVEKPEEVIGQVDAVILPTDVGSHHAERARPFVEAGLPIFVDKPMVDNEPDLKIFQKWIDEGKKIMSSSGVRYCKEFMPYRASANELGEMKLITFTMPKTWEAYGIHCLEGIYPILGPGFVSCRNTGSYERNVVHIKHKKGTDIVLAVVDGMYGGMGRLQLIGSTKYVQLDVVDFFYAFKKQLEAFIQFLRTGKYPFPFSETVELMKMVIAGIRSREENGREVLLSEIKEK